MGDQVQLTTRGPKIQGDGTSRDPPAFAGRGDAALRAAQEAQHVHAAQCTDGHSPGRDSYIMIQQGYMILHHMLALGLETAWVLQGNAIPSAAAPGLGLERHPSSASRHLPMILA